MSKKIYDRNLGYSLLRPLVDWCTKRSYRKLEVRGEENLPADGAILLAPNHCNTLMDALVMLQAHKGPTVFGARADMFKRPLIARIMFFLRILPMVRQRDGLRNVLKNHESFDTIVETLEHGVRFCMFPEGRHRAARSLLPLGKGITRAAVAANNRFGSERPVYIVPVGIEYGDYFRYRSTCLITYGKAINVTQFIKDLNVENEAQVMEPLRKELAERMSELITYIKDDENLSEKWSLTQILSRSFKKGGLAADLSRNQAIIAQIEAAMEEHPDQMKDLLERAEEFEEDIEKDNISITSFGHKCLLFRCIAKGLLAILGLPYFIFSLIASLPMWLTAWFIRKGLKDKAFGNTVNLGIRLGMGLIWFPIWTLICFLAAPWPIALGLTIAAVPSYSYFYDYMEFMRVFISDCRLMGHKKLCKERKGIENTFIELL